MEGAETDALELSCFVIGPIGSRLAPLGTDSRTTYESSIVLWEEVLEPACSAVGLVPVRSDRIAQAGEIPDQIFGLLRDADVVIADVTGGNPNVMYELGLRHTRNKATIQLGENDRLPFDVSTIRTIQFLRTAAGLIDLRENLVSALTEALRGNFAAVAATRIWQEAETYTAQSLATLASTQPSQSDTDAEAADAPGTMEVLAEAESAIEALGINLQESNETIVEIGSLVRTAVAANTESDQRGGGFAGRLRVMRKLGSDLAVPVGILDEQSTAYLQLAKTADAGVSYILDIAEADPSQVAGGRVGLRSIADFAKVADEAAIGVTEMMHGVDTMSGLSRDLRASGNLLKQSLNRYLTANALYARWRARIELLLTHDGGATGS